MSTTMRGKRWFAAIAASALGLGALAVAGAPAVQAAPTVSVYCAGNGTGVNGAPGALPDPTTVQPNCSITAAIGVNGKTSVGSTPFIGSTTTWVRMTISGDSTWDDTSGLWNPAVRPTVTNSGKTITLPASYMTTVATTQPSDDSAIINVATAGVRTIAVEISSGALSSIPPNNQFSAAGEFTVTGLGGTTTSKVSQGYYAVSQFQDVGTADDSAAIGIVHVVDEAGNVINTSGSSISNLTFNTSSGRITTEPYVAGDCAANGVLTRFDEGATANVGIVTDACATVIGAGVRTQASSGVWVVWENNTGGAAAPGRYMATFTLNMPNGATYPVTVPYVVSSTVAASWTLALDKTEYAPGATAVATASLVDLNGLPVPDGVGWNVPGPGGSDDTVNRSVLTASNNVDTRGAWNYAIVGAPRNGGVLYDDSFATYNGANEFVILVPAEAMSNYVISVTPLISGSAAAGNQTPQNGWLTPLQGVAKSVSAKIGNPTPPTQESIMIEGTRGVGDDANRVYVEGTTTSLVGKTVTPYFRFPGETGFTAGTGTRTVDAQGNFAWQRKTGKKIAVQFRAGDGVVSNTIIIEAK